jgi:DNA-binding NarL/FixJ family response regulator
MITIIILDGYPFSRLGLKAYINQFPNFKVVGEASCRDEAVALAKKLKPQIMIVDMEASGIIGSEKPDAIFKDCSDCKIITLSRFENEKNIVEMLQSGVTGLLLKSGETSELAQAIEKAYNNEEFYCRKAIEAIIRHFTYGTPKVKPQFTFNGFSEREMEIIKLICNQKTAKEIGGELYISEKTVDFHRQKIIEKMHVSNIIGLVVYAITKGLVDVKELNQE